MITHTMLVSFTDPISDSDLDQFISDIEKSMRNTGVVETFSAQHHIPVPGEEAIPAFIATAVLQFGVADRDALVALFAAPGAGEVIHKWQARHPYKVAWVNHRTTA
ncbi:MULTISPECIES: hypothetical protein [unclassified Streptomyces]|uniref:hypothetical protein n=1 Tax=Streptomyces TaxID=1883 RepID=UPI0001C1ABB2|nr:MULTISPECIES: hypothetical protein [unclassified Streptomyces]AEN08432.1 conserved hypothetical protein [Streptomyces sp. SirexAA-E]MYR69364.1 hypothetical protein [Streptomyces sp. SID4939]MYS02160.1 hypothetical protein [Streptomyces sp. SID4940]MYT66423.1 hypothetical protein [Streptomyces sp. SID8357]MYT83344.1 hypothetical protein [Streptomyces sp. SID8360]